MPPLRLHPLLIAGAACLTLAACGSDDDPPASQAKAPAQTEAPATTTAPSDTDSSSAETTSTTDAPEPSDASKPPTSGKQGAAPNPLPGGKPASASVAAAVRGAVLGLQEAFAAKNGEKACSLMIGIPEKDDPRNPGLSCESMSRGTKKKLSAENRKLVESAKVTVNGNVAIAELQPGVPLTLRNVGGHWRVDYSQMGRPAAGSR